MNVLMIDSPPLFVAGVADVLCKRDVNWHVWSARRPEDVLRLRDALLPDTVEAITIECDEHAARPSWPNLLHETFAATHSHGVPPGDDRAFERLTPRQREVLRLLAEGKSNKQICRVLNVAEGTIKNHLYALFRQIGVSNRTEAALWLARHVPSEPAAFPFAPACQASG